MTILLSDLIAPTGELTSEMFPDVVFEDTVEAWLAQAFQETSSYAAAVSDKAIKHWVYGRAYRTVARRLALQPNSATAEGISESVGIDRIRYFTQLAENNEAALEGLKQIPDNVEKRVGTRSVRTQVYF